MVQDRIYLLKLSQAMERKSTSKMANPAGVRAIIAVAFSGFIELMQPKNLLEMIKEMKTVLKDSRWMLPILLSIILLDMPVIIALISWIYVIFKTRFINKEEEILFKTFTGPIYKTRIVWMKVLSLSACFCVAKFGVEIFHFLTWLMDDSTGPILSVVFEMIIKCGK
ncbi:unnamed protein product [Allacma fusca]|uniref:Uncharacterized protein n=1 Tax=Allacma fusca TaxID=39272 RepID=A0A8J2P0R7_9HEXA|nr:unnamed protein product [Allacma fusca]